MEAPGRVELPTNGLGILQLYVLENTSTDKGHNPHNMASVAGYQGKLQTNYCWLFIGRMLLLELLVSLLVCHTLDATN